MSGFNEDLPPWAWQVGESLPREWTPCRYHGHGGLGWVENIERVSTRSGKLLRGFRGFPGNSERFWSSFFPLQTGFPGLNHCAFVQSLFMALEELQHHPGPFRAPWGSHFGVFNIAPVLVMGHTLSLCICRLFSLSSLHSLAVGSLFPVSCHSIPCPRFLSMFLGVPLCTGRPQLRSKVPLVQALP